MTQYSNNNVAYIPSVNVPFYSWAMKNTYIPANVPGQQNMSLSNKKYKEYDLSWWKDDCFFKYPYLLVSAAYGLAYPDFREKFEIPKDTLLQADSGGFQMVTKGEYLNPIDVLRWGENNCDTGFILDYPPYWDDGTSFFGELKDFEKNMNVTAKNTEIMTTNKSNDKYKLYGAIHGDNITRITKWYNACKEYDVQGWALAPKPSSDVFKIAQYGAFAIQNLDKPIHIFAISGINTMAITVYLSKYYKESITFDSSSYAKGCTHKTYTIPFNIGKKYEFGDNGHKVDMLPCNCPVCSVIKPEELWGKGSMPGALISLHNLYWYIAYSYTLQSLLKYDDLFMSFVKKFCNDKTLKAMEYLDYCIETEDIEKANMKYSHNVKSAGEYIQPSFRL